MEAAASAPAHGSTPAPQQSRRSSTSRSRRSHPSFSDLRLAPLSVPEPKPAGDEPKSPWTPGSIDPSTAHAYRANHASYLAGRSAPSTPGILRSSSRRQQYGGLSRKSHEDGEDDDVENVDPGYFAYNAVQVASHGGVPDHGTGYMDDKPKSMSESGLYKTGSRSKGNKHAPLKTANGDKKAKRKSHPPGTFTSASRGRGGRNQDREDDWLSHATMFTTSLLAEGKGQSWVSSQSSTVNLHSYTSQGQQVTHGFSSYHVSSDSDFDEALAQSTATLKPRNKSKRSSARLSLHGTGLPFDELDTPLRSPGLSTGWGSRFGSRAASRSNSRRGSRVALTKGLSGLSTPHDSSSAAYRFGAVRPLSMSGADPASTTDDEHSAATTPKVVPDFVDPSARAEIQASLASVARQQRQRERAQQDGGYFAGGGGTDDDDDDMASSSEDEKEVARLARTPGFGLGGFGILDRLVGLGNFALDEQGEGALRASDVEEEYEDEAETPRDDAGKKRGLVKAAVWRGGEKKVEAGSAGASASAGNAEGGWRDAAWLLSVASKVLL